jgi:acyl-CoA thioester hydrolase
MPRPEPLPLASYPARASAEIRYADLDRQGHVNNAVFATYSEIGRVAFLYDQEEPLAPEGCSFVVARLAINFREELFWPGTVEIGTGVVGIGRTSFTLVQGLYAEGRCVATTEGVLVLLGRSREPMPLPPRSVQMLEGLTLPESPRVAR